MSRERCYYVYIMGGWPTFASPRLRLPQPSRLSKGGHLGEWRRWVPRTSASTLRILAAYVSNELGAEVTGAHLSKCAKGGAAALVALQAVACRPLRDLLRPFTLTPHLRAGLLYAVPAGLERGGSVRAFFRRFYFEGANEIKPTAVARARQPVPPAAKAEV
jgi:hypothetical protein